MERINADTQRADKGYRDAIAEENEKLQMSTEQTIEVAAQLQEAQKTAAAAAAEATVVQEQVGGKSLAGRQQCSGRTFHFFQAIYGARVKCAYRRCHTSRTGTG